VTEYHFSLLRSTFCGGKYWTVTWTTIGASVSNYNIMQPLLREIMLSLHATIILSIEGYFNFCFIRGGNCGETNCPGTVTPSLYWYHVWSNLDAPHLPRSMRMCRGLLLQLLCSICESVLH